jgi:hypothetical protein
MGWYTIILQIMMLVLAARRVSDALVAVSGVHLNLSMPVVSIMAMGRRAKKYVSGVIYGFLQHRKKSILGRNVLMRFVGLHR